MSAFGGKACGMSASDPKRTLVAPPSIALIDIVVKAGQLALACRLGVACLDRSYRSAEKRRSMSWRFVSSVLGLYVQRYRLQLVPCRLCRALRARSAARLRYGSPQQPRSCGLHTASRAGGCRCRECRGRMRDRGMCEAHVDAIAPAPREHDAWRVPGHSLGGICQRPSLLGDGDRRRW